LGIIVDITFDKPDPDIAEVTIIGTGGYGESCVIHMGNGEWAVVDSCFDPSYENCLPLLYLKEIGVDIKSEVKLIVCTHWHDDHIKGISQLYLNAEASEFCFSSVVDLKKFLQLVKLDYTKYNGQKISNSSTVEFNKCLEILEQRTVPPKKASKNNVLYTARTQLSQIISLSPSDRSQLDFDHDISTLINGFGENKRIIINEPNSTSVVLFLKLGQHRAILGADLEVSGDNQTGWLDILDNHQNILDKKSSLLKISHHGSENGYHNRIWLELLIPNAIGQLTPYNKGYKLPKESIIRKYLSHTPDLYITSNVTLHDKPKTRDKQTEKMIRAFNTTVRESKFYLGIVRSRIPLNDVNANWSTELFGKALKL